MATNDPRVDAYIAKSQAFAQPILRHLRAVVHEACPDVEEAMKWSFPHFDYRGAMMCSMAAFKQHCAFGFWRGAQLLGADSRNAEAMGDFGRITSLSELPSNARIRSLVKQAMELTDSGTANTARKKSPVAKKPVRVPNDLAAALAKHKTAAAAFAAFPPSQRREYVEWITEAKTAATRERRLLTAIEWLTDGKTRNWKYQKP